MLSFIDPPDVCAVPAGQPLGFITGICPIYSDFTFSIEQYEDPKASVGSLEVAGKPMQASKESNAWITKKLLIHSLQLSHPASFTSFLGSLLC